MLRGGLTIGAWQLRDRFQESAAGHTYRAVDMRRPDERALVKVLRPELCGDEKALARYFDEVRRIDRLGHPHLIKVRDYGERASGEKYLVLEDVGESIDLMTALRRDGYVDREVALSIAIQMARALGALHEAGIVHQGLKPQCVVVGAEVGKADVVKILDAGDATLACPPIPGYMSPEQAAERPVDGRSDIYSLGVILYEMVTGRRPFDAETVSDYLFKHMTAEPPKPSELPDPTQPIPPALEELILVCLEKNPAMRPLSVKEVERSLRLIATGSVDATAEVPVVRDPGPPRPLWRLTRARVGVVAGAAVGVAALAWAVSRGSDPHPPAAVSARSPISGEPLPPPMVTAAPTIEVMFDSTPQGAEVFRAGTSTPLGKTPFRASFDPVARTETFEFRLRGHAVARRGVSLEAPGRVAVELASLTAPGPGEAEPAAAPPAVTPAAVPESRSRARTGRRAEARGAGAADKAPERTPRSEPEPARQNPYDKTGVIDPFE